MECKLCGSAAPDNAVFCPNCGGRVDGKKECPKCGHENDESYKFCVRCGTRIDGKKVCKNCGAEFEGAFCPQCGVKGNKCACEKGKNNSKKVSYNGVMKIVAISCGLFSALAAFIFMFFMGFEGEKTIFYYLGDSFKEIKEVKSMLNGSHFKGAVFALMYMDAITACLIAVATLASVTTFFTLTVTYGVFALLGKEKGNPIKMAIYTAFSYILGTALLYPFGGGELLGIKIGFNGATVAGLVLCSIGLAGATGCALATDYKRFMKKAFLARWICAGACIMFGVISYLMVRRAGAEVLVSGISVAEGSPGLSGATLLGLFVEMYYNEPILKEEMWAISAFSMVGTLFVLAAATFAIMALFRNIGNTVDEKKNNGMLWSILSFACSVGALIFTILIAKQAEFIVKTTEWSYGSVNMKIKYASSILAVVFSFVSMGIAIAAKIVSRKYKEDIDE